MTAITASHSHAGTTTFERSLLRAASALDQFVSHRLERRSTPEARTAATARTVVAATRDAAEAHAAIGMLPR